MVADDIKVRFSADAVSYQLAAIPVVSEESLGRQRERHPETREERENKACNQTDQINISCCTSHFCMTKKSHSGALRMMTFSGSQQLVASEGKWRGVGKELW